MASQVRLFVDHPLGEGQTVPLTAEQAHYLFSVMRLGEGDVLTVFDGQHGSWNAQVAQAGKKAGLLRCAGQTGAQVDPPDLWLLFAPIRKERTAFIVEKATEMGAARIVPVQTAFTNNADRLRHDKLRAYAVEAAEQCGGTYVPEVAPLARLADVLRDWPAERRLMFCDETRRGAASALSAELAGPWAVLIGPEGGFSPDERALLGAMPQSVPVSLGPRILRADTAVVAALTVWQQALGDWR